MKLITAMVIFIIAVNMGSILVQALIPQFSTSELLRGGLEADQNAITAFGKLNETIDPQGQGKIQNQGNPFIRITDWLGIGFLLQGLGLLGQFLYGFPILVKSVLGPYLSPVAANAIFRIMIVIITSMFSFFGFTLWTGKEL